jgi:GSH-dependent disulfide-bond oxidoreductase
LNTQLAGNEYVAGEYSIADIAAWPWVFRHDWQGQDLADFPNVRRWFDAVGERPAVRKGAAVGSDLANFSQPMSDDDQKRLFNIRDADLKAPR